MYKKPEYIHEPIGNNVFSYNERIALGSTGKIFVPSLIQGTVADLKVGSEICFEEVENATLKSHTGLQHFIQLDYHGKQIFIVDNHNHALSFWYQNLSNLGTFQPFNLIHIDQHADTKPNEEKLSGDIETFIHKKTNVGNFISAALHNKIINQIIQVRTEYALQNILHFAFGILPFILDIDIDFRQGRTDYEKDFPIIRKLIDQAELVTIATSPHFMDQLKAIEIIKKLLS